MDLYSQLYATEEAIADHPTPAQTVNPTCSDDSQVKR